MLFGLRWSCPSSHAEFVSPSGTTAQRHKSEGGGLKLEAKQAKWGSECLLLKTFLKPCPVNRRKMPFRENLTALILKIFVEWEFSFKDCIRVLES